MSERIHPTPGYGPWKEEWRAIPCCPKYDVNHLSEIRNRKTGRILKPDYRFSVKIPDVDNKPRAYRIYALSLLAFFPHITPLATVDHIVEGNRSNNHISNLQWATRAENSSKSHEAQEGVRQGYKHQWKPVQQWSGDGKTLLATFSSAKEAANAVSCCGKTISIGALYNRTAKGFVWKYVDDDDLPDEKWGSSPQLVSLLQTVRVRGKPMRDATISKIQVSNKGRYLTSRGKKNRGRIDDAYRYAYDIPVHLLVWAVWGGGVMPQKGQVICHDDRIPPDERGCRSNAIEHLRIDTHSNNMRESYKVGALSKKKRKAVTNEPEGGGEAPPQKEARLG